MRNLREKKFTWFVVFACMSALLVFAGCNKSEEAPATDAAVEAPAADAAAPAADAAADAAKQAADAAADAAKQAAEPAAK